MSEWVINREEILAAVDKLGLIPSRPGISSSEYICIKPRKSSIQMLLASEVSGYAIAKGKGNWIFDKPIYIDRRLFDPFISAARNIKSKSDFHFIKSGKTELTIINGTRKSKMTCSEPKHGYEDIGKTNGHEVKTEKELNTMLIAAKHCAEQETAVPELGCVYAKRSGKYVVLYATTGLLLFKARIKSKLHLKESIPFPLYIIDLLSNDKLVGVEATKKEVVLDFGNSKIWQTITVQAKKKFPYKQIDKQMQKQAKTAKLSYSIESKLLGQVVDRLIGYLSSVRRLDWTLVQKEKKDSKYLDLIVPLGHTTFKDKVRVLHKVHKDFEISWPLDRIVGIIDTLASKKEKVDIYFDKENRAYLKTKNLELLISRKVN